MHFSHRLLTASPAMDRGKVTKALEAVNAILASKGLHETVLITGGAAIMLHFKEFPRSVKDLDASSMSPALKATAEQVMYELDLPNEWFNDDAKDYYMPKAAQTVDGPQLSNLSIKLPSTMYLLCLKIMSGRPEEKANDAYDVKFLVEHMPEIKSDKDWQDKYVEWFGKNDWKVYTAEVAHRAIEEKGMSVTGAVAETTPQEAVNEAAEQVMEELANRPKPWDTPQFKAWFGASKVVNSDGSPKRVLHGTTHEFDEFKHVNPNEEGYYGACFYFTDCEQDAGDNYATLEGPDLSARIENLADQLMNDGGDWEEGIDEDEEDDDVRETSIRDLAYNKAKEIIAGQHGGTVYPLFLKMENPIVVSQQGGTYLGGDGGFEGEEEDEWVDGESTTAVYEAVRDACEEFDLNPDKIMDQMGDMLLEGCSAFELEKDLRSNDWVFDAEGGAGPVIASIYQRLGYDGVILDASAAFPSMNMKQGTKHYMVWKPTQIKSAIGNKGTFDPEDAKITAELEPKLAFAPEVAWAANQFLKLYTGDEFPLADLKKKMSKISEDWKKAIEYLDEAGLLRKSGDRVRVLSRDVLQDEESIPGFKHADAPAVAPPKAKKVIWARAITAPEDIKAKIEGRREFQAQGHAFNLKYEWVKQMLQRELYVICGTRNAGMGLKRGARVELLGTIPVPPEGLTTTELVNGRRVPFVVKNINFLPMIVAIDLGTPDKIVTAFPLTKVEALARIPHAFPDAEVEKFLKVDGSKTVTSQYNRGGGQNMRFKTEIQHAAAAKKMGLSDAEYTRQYDAKYGAKIERVMAKATAWLAKEAGMTVEEYKKNEEMYEDYTTAKSWAELGSDEDI